MVTGGFSHPLGYFGEQKTSLIINGENVRRVNIQCWTERADIVRHLNMVDAVISWDDADDSACGAIEKCLDIADKVIFCNGGDRQKETHLSWNDSKIIHGLSLSGV